MTAGKWDTFIGKFTAVDKTGPGGTRVELYSEAGDLLGLGKLEGTSWSWDFSKQAGLLRDIRGAFTSTDDLRPDASAEIDVRDPSVRASLPENVRESYDYYVANVEDEDWGTARLFKHEVSGREVYVTGVTTDGDDGYLEVFAKTGKPLVSARTELDQVAWDDCFGAVRDAVHF
ncbi:hypothetical protein ACFL59_15380 [Planctomycetota bacterium]